MPTTIEELLEQSKQCHNYPDYPPNDWEFIARFAAYMQGFELAYVILDSKHMRWNPIKTFEGFMVYAEEFLTPDELTYLLESAKSNG
jgi:hypothetical protein